MHLIQVCRAHMPPLLPLLRNAQGLLFLTVAKVAFIGGLRVGTGLIISRANTERGWSAPCAAGSYGLSFGAEVGAQTSDCIVPLSLKALQMFARGTGQMTVGGEGGLSLGPIGSMWGGLGGGPKPLSLTNHPH